MIFRGEELQEPTGKPNRKDSIIYRGFKREFPKCAICGEDACRFTDLGFICADCSTNPLISTLTERNEFELAHPKIFPPGQEVGE